MYVPPVAADVEHVHEGQRSHFFNRLFESLLSALHGEGWTILFPGVTNQSGTKIPDVLARRLGHKDCVPSLILRDAERPLVQAVRDLRATEVMAFPEMVGDVCPGRTRGESARPCHHRTGLQEIPSAHSPSTYRSSRYVASDSAMQVGTQGEGAIVVQFLVAGPANRIPHALHFDLGPKLQPLEFRPLGQNKLRLAYFSRQGIAGIEASAL